MEASNVAYNKEYQPGSGQMWRNNSDNPKAPMWSGKIKIPEGSEGKTMQIAAWFNEAYTNKEGYDVKENWGLSLSEPGPSHGDEGSRSDSRRERKDFGSLGFPPPSTRNTEKDDVPF